MGKSVGILCGQRSSLQSPAHYRHLLLLFCASHARKHCFPSRLENNVTIIHVTAWEGIERRPGSWGRKELYRQEEQAAEKAATPESSKTVG